MSTTTPVLEAIDETTARGHGHPPFSVIYEWITTVDHKKIGLMYIFYALIFLIIAGIEALLIRIQLAVPNNHFLSPQVFNQLFTMHGTTMVFFMGMPILFGVGNYLVPLMIGAQGYGVSATERVQLLDLGVWRLAALLLVYRSERSVCGGIGA